MPWRSQFKKTRRSSSPDFESIFYGLLCLALVGFFGWRWWVYYHGAPPAPAIANPKITNIVAIPKPVAPIIVREPPNAASRPVHDVLEAQIALARQGISCGSIDGVFGPQTRLGIIAFQKKQGLDASGRLDGATKSNLLISRPIMTEYVITADDFARLLPLSKTWLGKSQQPRLDFSSILELIAEKAFSSPTFIRALNPNIEWNALSTGARVIVPELEYPPVTSKAAMVTISLHECALEAFDANSNLLAHFPCSIGRVAEKRPVGELRVENIAIAPNYTFDPALFPEAAEAQGLDEKLVLPPGPRNPVGTAWIGLDRPGYGIHGTPAPEKVGRTESHGCFRLANWNADYLARLVWIGMPVTVEP